MDNSHEIDVTEKVLLEELYCNREIEFELGGRMYFATPSLDISEPHWYDIWDVKDHICIFKGDIVNLFNFTFPNGISLSKHFSFFKFLYIY